jgi:hypothetical protein
MSRLVTPIPWLWSDLEPLQQHALEGDRECVRVNAGDRMSAGGARGRAIALELGVLVAQPPQNRSAQDGLAQPLQAEGQEQAQA